jgi:hypothetical protein
MSYLSQYKIVRKQQTVQKTQLRRLQTGLTYLVIPHLSLLIQRQSDQAVDLLRNWHGLGRILLLEFEDDLVRFGRDNFCLNRPRGLHEFRDTCCASVPRSPAPQEHISTLIPLLASRIELTIPLSRDLIPRIAITPRVVVNRFLSVHLHVFFACASRIQVAYRLDDLLLR